jgi:ATP-binding cassette subfamily C exporter for protease/lipase
LGAGATLVIYGEISPGAMIAASALMGRATHPVDALVGAWKELREARIAFLELEKAFSAWPKQSASVPARADAARGAEIELKNVRVFTPCRSSVILRDISLRVPAGMALGITGASGSGKSTLARVFLGICPEMEGEARFDGASLCGMARAELGPQLGYLPQEAELFAGSVAENVARFGEANAGKIIAACQMAGVHEMILRFPEGYDAPVGDGGRFLSGGQRQRIGLARALYGEPRLVVLDEPNAHLDDAGDRALFSAVRALKARGVTLALISHRPQILSFMDRVLVLEKGAVLRMGTPGVNRLRQISAGQEYALPAADCARENQ